MGRDRILRRTLLGKTGATIALGTTVGLAGCSSGDDGGDGMDGSTSVAVGPDGDFVFDPEEVTVSTGETVTWTFESPSHNVSAKPDAHDEVSIPDDAEGFASYEGDDHFRTNEEGETFEHTFETAGEYTYVCVPHAGQGMVGTVVVEE